MNKRIKKSLLFLLSLSFFKAVVAGEGEEINPVAPANKSFFAKFDFRQAASTAAGAVVPPVAYAAYTHDVGSTIKNFVFGSSYATLTSGFVCGVAAYQSYVCIQKYRSLEDEKKQKVNRDFSNAARGFKWSLGITTLFVNIRNFYKHVQSNRLQVPVSVADCVVENSGSLLSSTVNNATTTSLETFSDAALRIVNKAVRETASNLYKDRHVLGTVAATGYGVKKATQGAYALYQSKKNS